MGIYYQSADESLTLEVIAVPDSLKRGEPAPVETEIEARRTHKELGASDHRWRCFAGAFRPNGGLAIPHDNRGRQFRVGWCYASAFLGGVDGRDGGHRSDYLGMENMDARIPF